MLETFRGDKNDKMRSVQYYFNSTYEVHLRRARDSFIGIAGAARSSIDIVLSTNSSGISAQFVGRYMSNPTRVSIYDCYEVLPDETPLRVLMMQTWRVIRMTEAWGHQDMRGVM